MNANEPPPFTPPPTAAALPLPNRPAEAPVHLPRLLLGLLVAVAAFDLCFWDVKAWGFSVAVFFLALGGVILANRDAVSWKGMTGLLVALLVGAAGAATLETGVTNTFVLLGLVVVLAGETFYREVESRWGRWLSQGVALIFAPGRVFWLSARIMEVAFGKGLGWAGGVIGGFLLMLPALVLTLIFGSLLASGNAVFGSWTNSFFTWLETEFEIYCNPPRMILWLFIAFLVLPLLRPARVASFWWRWMEQMPRLPEIIPSRAALFSSVFTLVMLNLLFLVANTADALFLWSGQTVSGGLNNKNYVHEGVNSLIATVILTAIVLTAIFQQELNVSRRRELKALALVWIAQNVFLLFSVALRIKFYIEAFEMTVARLGVIIFLMVVGTGFVLLTIKILKEKSLSWLIGGCILTVFVSFYLTQFLDLSGWSANYNIAQWEKDRTRQLDFFHLYEYGPDAWPALRRAHDLDPSIAIFNTNPNLGAVTTDTIHLADFDAQHWREFSLRAWLNRGAVEEQGK